MGVSGLEPLKQSKNQQPHYLSFSPNQPLNKNGRKMGDSIIGGQGNFDEYNDLLRFWDKKQAELKEYKGVNLKNEKGKTISLRFTLAGKRVAKSCNESFTESGMIRAVEKAKKVYEALQR